MLRTAAIGAAILVAFLGAAAPPPSPSPDPHRINVQDLQPRAIFPKKHLHVEVTVEINRLGQVTRVRTIKPSHDRSFDAHTYGNALQAFIRTGDGNVVLGTYRLTYDYDPVALTVHRSVALIKRGGVNPNAQGAALAMLAIAARRARAVRAHASPVPVPAASINPRRLPDLPQVMKSPSH